MYLARFLYTASSLRTFKSFASPPLIPFQTADRTAQIFAGSGKHRGGGVNCLVDSDNVCVGGSITQVGQDIDRGHKGKNQGYKGEDQGSGVKA
jgi:hypothetical protein